MRNVNLVYIEFEKLDEDLVTHTDRDLRYTLCMT